MAPNRLAVEREGLEKARTCELRTELDRVDADQVRAGRDKSHQQAVHAAATESRIGKTANLKNWFELIR